jgi:hypothetical protein
MEDYFMPHFLIYTNKHLTKYKSWTFNLQEKEQKPLISKNKNKTFNHKKQEQELSTSKFSK